MHRKASLCVNPAQDHAELHAAIGTLLPDEIAFARNDGV